MQQGPVISIDSVKAYDLVHHNYMTAFFLHMALQIPMIALLMFIFKALFVFALGKGVVKGVEVTPALGIKQGDPLSPATFVMACSVLVKALQHTSPKIHGVFYVDDLFLYIPQMTCSYTPPPPNTVCALLPLIFEMLRKYGIYVRLRLNLGNRRS